MFKPHFGLFFFVGGFSVRLQPPVVINLLNLLIVLGMGGLWGISKVNIMNAFLVISVILNSPGLNSLLLYIGQRGM